jgi:hypothetical protein
MNLRLLASFRPPRHAMVIGQIALQSVLLLPFGVSGAQRIDQRSVARDVAAQAIAARLQIDPRNVPTVSEGDVEIELLTGIVPGARGVLLRTKISSWSHSSEYLVWAQEDRHWRLGGFASPEILELVATGWLPDSRNVLSVCRHIAMVLDEQGARRIIFPAFPAAGSTDSATAAVIAKWKRVRADEHAADTVIERSDGKRLVRITTLSWAPSYDRDFWYPSTYQFIFDRKGLAAWSVSRGRALP